MDKYRLVEGRKGEGDEFLERGIASEVRITQQGKPRNYISYAMTLFSEGSNAITLKAMGRAINKAVTIAEILKRKMPLHQITSLSSCEMIDLFEPLEEGLDVVTNRRYVSCMRITLSKEVSEIDKKNIGYQPPLPLSDISPGDTHPSQQKHQQQPKKKQHQQNKQQQQHTGERGQQQHQFMQERERYLFPKT
mmetsp:Transcript_14635/g.16274  ORF Transcript_14635/g.16274 Transcript_14635/m.16274 type:complete len:192 (-) Transcript_14635:399-974(-)|eukprot:CAMPEP_0194130938 /NCGR_PEP_ID=MMETSP0152-20130528/1829_1 /TAXON_ID=1049557 /ORGANISM="Thalassiothrix antarctica, Strain L6-D1" /LENGTH=191 /DNA_ID=CAMNT_0038825577 /DNA_START=57 /DNA_END=632 /DNA_ORIENTATION=-